MHTVQNLLDNNTTIDNDLSQPTIQSDENDSVAKKKKRRVKKRQQLASENNFNILSQERLNQEIDFENTIDLEKTIWYVIRDSKSCNNILGGFETKQQFHYLKVNDVIKCGRVHFRVGIIKSDRLRKDIQGGYHLFESNNLIIQ